MTTPRAGEPDMPDLTSLKATCANANHDHKYISKVECEDCQTYIATFNPTLIARLLAVCEAAQGYLDYLDSGNLKPHGGEERRQAIRLALTALGGQE